MCLLRFWCPPNSSSSALRLWSFLSPLALLDLDEIGFPSPPADELEGCLIDDDPPCDPPEPGLFPNPASGLEVFDPGAESFPLAEASGV
jgi:hypothetical protein